MTPQESSMLNDLAGKIQQTQLPEKDAEAEELLQQRLGSNPDSLYILAQTVLVQNIALDRAKAQMQQLQQQLQEAQSHPQAAPQPAHTSFLGSLLGRHDAPPPPAYPQRPPMPPAQYYPPAPAYPPDYSAAPPPQSGGSSFLRSAATTAAGVAAGALAFEGVESLLHGFGHSGGGFGESFGGGGFGGRPEETVVNNYYDDPNQNAGASSDERLGNDQGGQIDDAQYQPGGADYVGGQGVDVQGVDTLDADDTTGGIDDSNYDDSSNFDDGGSDSSDV
jgi:hypothetical protein